MLNLKTSGVYFSKMNIKKCSCGSTNFFVNEEILYKAGLLEDGTLEIYKDVNSEITHITCKDCGKEYSESDFKEINF